MLASVLAGTTPLAAFTRSGEFTELENREPLLLDTRRGERARVRRSLFGGGGAGTVESDSQSAIPRSKSGLDSTHSGITSRLGLTISSSPSRQSAFTRAHFQLFSGLAFESLRIRQ